MFVCQCVNGWGPMCRCADVADALITDTGDLHPYLIHGFLGPTQLFIQNGMSISSAVFVWVSNAMLYNALSMRAVPHTSPLHFTR